MKYRQLFVQNILVILFGVTVFYLDHVEFGDSYNMVLVLVFALIKCGFFIMIGFKNILAFSTSDLDYHDFLLFIGLSIALIIFSFAIDYICLYQIDPSSFSGIEAELPWYLKGVKLLFFSILIFSNLGVATVLPENMISEFLMVTEAILSFVTIILILSDFISLKESLNKYAKAKAEARKQSHHGSSH